MHGDKDIKEIEKYDTIILGGGIYASRHCQVVLPEKNIGKLTGKKILVFCCSVRLMKKARSAVQEGITRDMLSQFPSFIAAARRDMDAMSLRDRTLCNLLQKGRFQRKTPLIAVWEKDADSRREDKCDWTDKSTSNRSLHTLGKMINETDTKEKGNSMDLNRQLIEAMADLNDLVVIATVRQMAAEDALL